MAWSDHCDKYGLTPSEAKLFDALSDGAIHYREELQKSVLGIKFAHGNLVGVNMYRMRAKLAPHGIVIEGTRRFGGWRLVMPGSAS
jgi:DNA-binding response OmpR family regulator